MTVEEIERLAAGLAAVVMDIEAMPDQLEVTDARMHCSHAQMIVADYARHLRAGMEPFDALRTAAVGEFNTLQKQNFWSTIPKDDDE